MVDQLRIVAVIASCAVPIAGRAALTDSAARFPAHQPDEQRISPCHRCGAELRAPGRTDVADELKQLVAEALALIDVGKL